VLDDTEFNYQEDSTSKQTKAAPGAPAAAAEAAPERLVVGSLNESFTMNFQKQYKQKDV